MRFRQPILLASLALLLVWSAGCGGNGSKTGTSNSGSNSDSGSNSNTNTNSNSGSNSGSTTAAISVSLTPAPPTSLLVGSTANLTAVVTNDTQDGGVTWSVTCNGGACGSFTPTATATGVATAYQAPATVPTGNTVTVTATSATDTTKSASATIAVTPPLLSDGTYIYNLSGQDGTGPYFVAGAFTVQTGVITGGEQDFGDATGYYPDTKLLASGSSLSLAADGNMTVTLNTGNSNMGSNGVETLRGTVVSSSRVLISEFDSFAGASGSLDLQTANSALSNGYAFSVGGVNTGGEEAVIGGILNFSSGNLSVGNSVFDSNDGTGNVQTNQAFTSGSVTNPDSLGRVTITLASGSFSQLVLVGYMVNTNRIWLVESNDQLGYDLGGSALGQGTNTGTFTQAGVAGTTYVYGAGGEDQNGFLQAAAALTLNADTTVSGVFAMNDLTVFGSAPTSSGSWTVGSNGRVTITGVGTTLEATPLAFELYLDGNGNALELGVDTFEATAGTGYLQQNNPTAPSAGNYAIRGQGTAVSTTAHAGWGGVGPVTFDGSGNLTGFADVTLQGMTPVAQVTLSGTTNSGNGTLAVTGFDQNTQGSVTLNYFTIDATRSLALETDGQQLGLVTFEGVQP
jgi:hypothetical protein